MFRPSVMALVMVLVMVGAVGCNEPPLVRSVDAPASTSITTGPYEVRVTAFSDDGFGAARLIEVSGDAHVLARDETSLDGRHGRFLGSLPGQPVGTVIRFAVEVCDAFDVCALDPGTFPVDAHELRVVDDPAALRIDAVSPNHGSEDGGQVVEVTGAGFPADVAVSFDDVAAPHVERLSGTRLRVVTPAHPPGLVAVALTSGTATVDLPDAFTFVPAARIVAVAPASGPTRGGTAISITGERFELESRIFVDGLPCRRPLFVSETELACETPPGRAGAVDVVIESGDRVRTTAVAAFTYIEGPVIDGVEPSTGNSDGGTVIVVRGSNFDVDSVVFVGGAPCIDVTVVAEGLQCITTAADAGAADVIVVNADEQQGVLPGGFGFLGPPLVLLVDPDVGPYAGGIEVRLLGAGLAVDDEVSFGGAVAEVIDAVDDLELVVVLPPSILPLEPAPADGLAAVDVVVRRNRADDQREHVIVNGFSYRWPPEVAVVQPDRGPTAGGTRVVVVGRFFAAGTTVRFDGEPCTDVAVISNTELVCTTPPGDAGPADVVASSPDGGDGAVAEGAYTYVPPPRVDAISPPEGPTFGGERVTVTGAFFQPGMALLIDGNACVDVTVLSDTELSCETPPGDRGPADVTAVNPDGQFFTAPGLYLYVGVAVTPDHGLPVGFTRVRVRAAGLDVGVVLTFGGRTAVCERVSSREAICQTPARIDGRTGPVEVRFRNPDGTTDADNAFTYTTFADVSDRAPSVGRNANHVAVADVDGDGDADFVVANGRAGATEASEVYRNNGSGTFSRADIPGTEVTGNTVDVGTINSDGFPDLVISASDAVGAVLLASSGPGTWNVIELPLTADNSAFDAQLANLVGDARDDLLVLGIGCDVVLDQQQSPGCDPSRQGREALFEQTGQGGGSRLSARNELIPHEARQVHDHKMIIFDADGDDDNDIFVVTNNDPYVSAEHRLLRNRVSEGRGFVKETAGFQQMVGDLYDIDAGDIDGDGDDDVVTSICLGDGQVSSEAILRNDGGSLRVDDSALPSFRENCAVGVQLVDVDSDGDLDVMWSGTVDARRNLSLLLRLYVNRGDGTFVDASVHLPESGRILQGNNIAAADVDGDGDTDLIVAGGAPYAETDRQGAVLLFEQR